MTKVVNAEKLQKAINWSPHQKQKEIIDAYLDGKRKIVVSSGIRSGKSMTCAFIVLLELMSEGKEILVISPSYSLTDRVLDYVKQWLAKLFSVPVNIQTKPFPKIELNWSGGKSYVEGKSAEAEEQILGKSYDLIVIDEASRIPRRIFEQYLLPRISEKAGKLIMISTPFQKDWFFEEFLKAKKDNAGFQFSSVENPFFPKTEYEKRKEELPKTIFDREFNAVFSDEITSIFPNAHECISLSLPREAIEGHYHYIGLDLAKEEDWTAIAVADSQTNEIVFITRWQKLPYSAQLQKVLGIASQFKPYRIIIDSRNIGAIFGEQLRNEGIWTEDWVSTGTISKDFQKRGSKEKLVEKTMALFESRSIGIPNNSDLLDELSSYSYVISLMGNIRYGVPLGLHDDLVDALMLVCWNLKIKTGISSETEADRQLRKGWQEQKRLRILRDRTFI